MKREEEAASKLSNKSNKPKRPKAFNYNLSIALDDKGHVLSPEGYMMAEEMMKYI